MQNKEKNVTCGLFATVLVLGLAGGDAYAEGKSLWQKISDFFSPMETVEGEGPLYDQLRSLDSEIGRTEGKYSRERRRGNKARFQRQLDSLQLIRDSLVVEIKKQQAADSVAKVQNAALPKSPATVASGAVDVQGAVATVVEKPADAKPLSGVTIDSATVAASTPAASVAKGSAAGALATDSASASATLGAKQNVACTHDTVYVRDTVYVHDTLYVMLANKPEPQRSKDATGGTLKNSAVKKETAPAK